VRRTVSPLSKLNIGAVPRRTEKKIRASENCNKSKGDGDKNYWGTSDRISKNPNITLRAPIKTN